MKKPELSPEQVTKNNQFLDAIMTLLTLKNDAALSRALDVAPPVVSKIRHGVMAVGPKVMVRVHELTGMLFTEIRTYVPKTNCCAVV